MTNQLNLDFRFNSDRNKFGTEYEQKQIWFLNSSKGALITKRELKAIGGAVNTLSYLTRAGMAVNISLGVYKMLKQISIVEYRYAFKQGKANPKFKKGAVRSKVVAREFTDADVNAVKVNTNAEVESKMHDDKKLSIAVNKIMEGQPGWIPIYVENKTGNQDIERVYISDFTKPAPKAPIRKARKVKKLSWMQKIVRSFKRYFNN